ncbi:MAG: hypothetical protein WKF65_08620 [Gaiellaceae bacterium]
MTLRADGEDHSVRVDAWIREGADVARPGWRFTDDDIGRAARKWARLRLAAGLEAPLGAGVELQLAQRPELFDEVVGGAELQGRR